MALSFDWANKTTYTGTANPAPITTPAACVAGDYLLLFIASEGENAGYTSPVRVASGGEVGGPGWVKHGDVDGVGSGLTLRVYGRWASDVDAAGGATYSFSNSDASDITMVMVAVSGARKGRPVAYEKLEVTAAGTSHAMTQIAPIVPGGHLVVACASDVGSQDLSIASSTPTLTERADIQRTNSTLIVGDAAYADAETLDVTFGSTSSDACRIAALIIVPAIDDYSDELEAGYTHYDIAAYAAEWEVGLGSSDDGTVETSVWVLPGELIPASQEVVAVTLFKGNTDNSGVHPSFKWRQGTTDLTPTMLLDSGSYPNAIGFMDKLAASATPDDLNLRAWTGSSSREAYANRVMCLIFPFGDLDGAGRALWEEDDDSASPTQLTSSPAGFASVELPGSGDWLVFGYFLGSAETGGTSAFTIDLHDGTDKVFEVCHDYNSNDEKHGSLLFAVVPSGKTVTLRAADFAGGTAAYHYLSRLFAVRLADVIASTPGTTTVNSGDVTIATATPTATVLADRVTLFAGTYGANYATSYGGVDKVWVEDASGVFPQVNGAGGETIGDRVAAPGYPFMWAVQECAVPVGGSHAWEIHADQGINATDAEWVQIVSFATAGVGGGSGDGSQSSARLMGLI